MATPDGDAKSQHEGEQSISPTGVCDLDFSELVVADVDWNESISDLNRAAWWWKNHPYKQMRVDYSRFARKKVLNTSTPRERSARSIYMRFYRVFESNSGFAIQLQPQDTSVFVLHLHAEACR
jgi:hypothetical protein